MPRSRSRISSSRKNWSAEAIRFGSRDEGPGCESRPFFRVAAMSVCDPLADTPATCDLDHMQRPSRRVSLIAIASALLVFDGILFLSGGLGKAPSELSGVKLESFDLVRLREEPLPWLRENAWVLEGAQIKDMKQYALRAASNGNMTPDGPLVLISLGPRPTFGQFIRSAHSLQSLGLCHVLVREGGRDHGPVSFGEDLQPRPAISIPALTICGRTVGDM